LGKKRSGNNRNGKQTKLEARKILEKREVPIGDLRTAVAGRCSRRIITKNSGANQERRLKRMIPK